MQRIAMTPRPDRMAKFKAIGFDFAHLDGQIYWDESVAYRFSMRRIEEDIESPAEELAALALEVAARVIGDERRLRRLGFPDHAFDLIARSWRAREPTLYGRFDFAYDGCGPAKLYEYNADTPTSLFEAGVVQWFWLEDMIAANALPSGADQFNSVHEKLIAQWRRVASSQTVHFTGYLSNLEDRGALAYLADCALQAGLTPKLTDIADIALEDGRFLDDAGEPIDCAFKLYPWEWMFADEFGRAPAMQATRWIEPPWKAVLSNKGFMALMWEAEPGHPNLLPTYFENDARAHDLRDDYARKPLFAREGANIALYDGARIIEKTSGSYGAEGYVRQALHLLPNFDGFYPLVGAWIIGGAAAGMGVREDSSPITSNIARFIPHYILD